MNTNTNKFQNGDTIVIKKTNFTAVVKMYDAIKDKYLISPSPNCTNSHCSGNCSQWRVESSLKLEEHSEAIRDLVKDKECGR